jgi:hypothetical protein
MRGTRNGSDTLEARARGKVTEAGKRRVQSEPCCTDAVLCNVIPSLASLQGFHEDSSRLLGL